MRRRYTVTRHTTSYVHASDLIPDNWRGWFWECVSENAPFSWGDNNHSLITASDFARHCGICMCRVVEDTVITQERADAFVEFLQEFGETYIDLEN